jgi:Bacterial Ig domain
VSLRLAKTAVLAAAILSPAVGQAADPAVIYLNFSDGTETLTRAENDNAVLNQSALGAVTPYPAFTWPGIADGSISRRDLVRTIAERVNEVFLPYNVLITTTRPASGPYTMVMIGGSPTLFGFDARIGGVALMDCNNQSATNIVFAFPTALRGSLHGLFVTAAQEAAHAYGLEHTVDTTDIMYPKVDPAQREFANRENAISGDRLCGRETQNSHRRLLEVLGPWPGGEKPFESGSTADTTPPVVAIAEPAGTVLAQPFVLRATVQDDSGVDEVVVEAGGTRFTATRPPYAWSLDGFEAGPLTLTVTARDPSGNRGSATAQVMVAGGAGGCAVGARRGKTGAAPVWVLFFVAHTLAACGRRRRHL